MRAIKLLERIGTKVKAQWEIVHSVHLTEPPLTAELVVDYLKGDSGELFVQVGRRHERKAPLLWSLAAIEKGDFGNLKDFRTFAEDVMDDDKPVVKLRTAIIGNAKEAGLLKASDKSQPRETVVHSRMPAH